MLFLQEIAKSFLGTYQCSVLPLRIFSSAPQGFHSALSYTNANGVASA